MSKTGFIGFGAMGKVMVEALLEYGALKPEEIVITTRTPAKLNEFIKRYPAVTVTDTIAGLAKMCSGIFICTGTKEVKTVLEEVVRYAKDPHIITITGVIELKCLESVFHGRISRIMPTQIGEVGAGVTLVLHNAKATPADRAFIREAFGKIGRVNEITEEQMDLAADLAGCAPAFYAVVLRTLTEAALNHGSMTDKDINDISLATMYGTAKLMLEKGVAPEKLIERVATPGGITEEGVKILGRALPAVFEEVFRATLAKREKTCINMRKQYGLE